MTVISELLKFTALLVCILGYCFFFTKYFKWTFEATPFFTVSLLACLVYIASLFGLLKLAPPVLLAVGIILFVYCVIDIYFRHNKDKYHKLNIFSIYIFIALFFVFFYLTRSLRLVQWDEYSHWGLVTQEILYYNRLPITRTTIYAVSYPPLFPLLEYFVCKIIKASEPNMYFANALFFISACMLFIAGLKKKRYILSLALMGFFFILTWGFGDLTVNIFSLYADSPMSIIFCGIIIDLLTTPDPYPSNVYRIIPAIICLTIAKEISVELSMTILALAFVYSMKKIDIRKLRADKNLIKLFLPTIIIALCVFAAYFSWQLHLKIANLSFGTVFADQPFALGHFGKGSLDHLFTLSLRRVFLTFLYPSSGILPTFTGFFASFESPTNFMGVAPKISIVFYVILLVVIGIFYRSDKKWDLTSSFVMVQLGAFVLYLFSLLFTYLFVMEAEGAGIPSFPRYIYPFLLSIGVTFTCFLVHQISEFSYPIKTPKQVAVILFSLLLFGKIIYQTPFGNVAGLIYRSGSQDRQIAIFYAQKFENIIPETAKVFQIYANNKAEDSGDFQIRLKYIMAPRIFQFWGWGFTTEKGTLNYGDTWAYVDPGKIICPPSELFNALKTGHFDFVFVTYADDKFWKEYGSLFDKTGVPFHSYLYRVDDHILTLISDK